MKNKKTSDLDNKVSDLRVQINEISKIRKKRIYSRSRLNKHLEEILLMRFDPEINASYIEISMWLRKHKRIVVTLQAVKYFIDKHTKEIQADNPSSKFNIFIRKDNA
jgi:hypothetical protein